MISLITEDVNRIGTYSAGRLWFSPTIRRLRMISKFVAFISVFFIVMSVEANDDNADSKSDPSKNDDLPVVSSPVTKYRPSGKEPEPVEPEVEEPVVEPDPIIIRVTGYGAFDFKKKKQSQTKRLKAIRASRLDAYRNLAERVYGYSLSGQSSVNNFALGEDKFKASVDSVVRGAKVVSISENPKTGIETVLELELPWDFHDCINRVNNFDYRKDCLRPMTHADQETALNLYSSKGKKDNSMPSLYHLK